MAAERTNQTLARTLIAVYGPTVLASIGFGAVIPLVAIQARALGASVGVAAFITALTGIAQVIGDLPAGTVTDRIGEKYSIVLACLVDAAAMAVVFCSGSLVVLALAVFCHGLTGSVFGLARQTYLTERVPLGWRARAMSTLGGVMRIGWFVGPLAAAAIVNRWGLTAAFAFAAAMSLVAAAVTLTMPTLPGEEPGLAGIRQRNRGEHARTLSVLRRNRHVLLTLGVGCLALQLVRAVRQTIVPLWCEAHGISAATTSLIYSMSMGCDVLLFFPGGFIMDRLGRRWVTLPAICTMSIGLLVLPLTHHVGTIVLVAALLGLGNGVSSGIIVTLGADASPVRGRAQFLAGWRLFADSGNALGPLVVSGVASLAGLPVSALTVGGIGLLGTWWLARHVPRTVEA
ncbi:Sugar transporter, conserved site [Propionibacterium ruminifibrarum]|uniref:Sugar transporter, conserved site n=1 Tax=Propionibacterium ruminifibrarum TaxID=1962131 RepID=A0A375I7I6_9ACTN|nr:MFS transporter [Propionibacterium ruminifibrarum]SPF69496.1 Sugar transporter, conserved site [Propionibacterium ruminifibrarum]